MKYLQWRALSAVAVLGSLAACDGDQANSPTANLVNVEAEPKGAHCDNGGQRIETGADSNRDGELSRDEVTKTAYACNGPSGADGETGADGVSGQTSLVDVSAEPAGNNCRDGGQKVSTGLDANNDEVLDANEVHNVFYLCQGAEGYSSVVSTTSEPTGANCANGGQKLSMGMDLNRNGELDSDEIEADSYICNGAVGATGSISLAAVTDEPPGEHCPAGGKRIDTGVDADGDDVLSVSEVAQTSYVCNGADGAASLVSLTDELAGQHCANGGQRIDQGVDDNGDGDLQPGEITNTRYVCNGTDGTNGFSSLISVSPIAAGAICASGGQKVSIGLDNGDGNGTASNGALEPGEVDSTSNLCNGADGKDGTNGEDGTDGAGGVHLIDANGADLGRLVGTDDMLGNNMTLISPKGYVYALYLYNLTYYPSTIYFANNNCTGTAFTYSPMRSGENSIGGLFAVNIDSVGWFASLPNTYSASRGFASYRSNATCQVYNGTTSGFTVVPTTAAAVGLPATAPATPASLQ